MLDNTNYFHGARKNFNQLFTHITCFQLFTIILKSRTFLRHIFDKL
jgi:hypothetical protein